MRSQTFCQAVGKIVGIDVTDAQVRHAIRLGDLTPVDKRGGWYVFNQSHVEQMVDHLRRRSRKLLTAELSTS
jgi:hypothetical protein